MCVSQHSSGFPSHTQTVCSSSYGESPQTGKQISACSMMQIPLFEDSLGSSGTTQKEPQLIHQALSSITGVQSFTFFLLRIVYTSHRYHTYFFIYPNDPCVCVCV